MAKTKKQKATEAAAPAEDAPVGLVAHILHARKGLRGSWDRQVAMGTGEERLLFYVMLACFFAFIAGLPGTFEAAERMGVSGDVRIVIMGRLFGFVILGPLLFYGIAALAHLFARWGFGGQASWFEARLGLFWSMVLAIPLILLYAMAAQVLRLNGETGLATSLGAAVGVIWAYIWLSFLAFAEGFARRKTFALAAAIALILVCFTLLLR